MLAKDIATNFRTQTQDTDLDTEDQLWSDAEVLRYMNLAVNDFAKKTLCISDAQTASIVELAVLQDDPWVPYSDLILEFDPQTVYSQGQSKNLPIMDKYAFERAFTGDDYGVCTPGADWQSKAGTPRLLIANLEMESLRAYPIPTAADTLVASVRRLPTVPLSDISDISAEVPEIPAKFHEDLIVFMMHRAYLKQDAECYDKGLAERYLQEWIHETLPSARRLLKRVESPKRTVSRYRSNG